MVSILDLPYVFLTSQYSKSDSPIWSGVYQAEVALLHKTATEITLSREDSFEDTILSVRQILWDVSTWKQRIN